MPGYIQTYTKIRFYTLEPVKEDVNIEDIAHSLSLMTRANGHCKHFYSVGQHSINCFQEAVSRGCSLRVQLGCLLHDASESYISDLTRPVKRNFPEYIEMEKRLEKAIFEKFGLGDLTREERKQICEVDDTLLYLEFEELMESLIFEEPPYVAGQHDFSQRDFLCVEREFMTIFKELSKKIGWSE